jgi:hypothetical protein
MKKINPDHYKIILPFSTAVTIIFVIIGFIFSGCKDSEENNKEQELLTWVAPQHPFLAPNGRNNVHNDGYMTDCYSISGPEGNNLKLSFLTLPRIFITICFDSNGRIISLGTGADGSRGLYLVDPDSMKIIDSYELPASANPGISGSGYFCLDNQDRVIVPTTNKHILKFSIEGNPSKFVLQKDYDFSYADSSSVVSVIPDWKGNLWYVTEEGWVVILHDDGSLKGYKLNTISGNQLIQEKIGNSFAVDESGGVYVVSDHALYCFEAGERQEPVLLWREEYDRGTQQKQGQFGQGSGTTPTLIGNDYVAITDNAEPRMNVLVYKRSRDVKGKRLLCKIPVFKDNASATENSLIAFHNSIIVENNYGCTKAKDFAGKFSEPGMTRIDFHTDGSNEVVWESDLIVPSIVSKYSSKNNIVYTYSKEPDGWYLTGVDMNTGLTKFQTKAGGDELRYNNYYSGLAIGPNGSAYIGCAGGIIRFSE